MAAPRYVKISDPRTDLSRFPDFLIVGPQRTGTTWLHANLRYHPEIMLSEPKELFFFSSLKDPSGKRFRSNELEWYLRFFREPLWRRALRHAMSLRSYGQLYRPRVRGEATASYAAMDPDVIADIVAIKPDVKAILMIRDPVDRAWSHAKKDLVRNARRQFADVRPEEFTRFFRDPYQLRCARYSAQIENWTAALQPNHLFVALFDDVATRPEPLLLEVMSFLGVSSDRRYISAEARKTINATGTSRIPDQYRRDLESLLQDEINRLRTRLGLSWTNGTLQRDNPRE